MDELKRTVKYQELIEDINNNVLFDESIKASYKAMMISELLQKPKYRFLTLTTKETAEIFQLLVN
jgi:hypothetical protein